MARKTGTGTPATALLAAGGIRHTVHPYPHDPSASSYGVEAAQALRIEPERVFKTLLASVDGVLTVAVVPVSGMLDFKALAAARGGKRAELAETTAAERSTGYVVGGISPLGQRKALPTVIDASALDFATIFVSAGRRGLDVELAPADLVALTRAVIAPLARRMATRAQTAQSNAEAIRRTQNLIPDKPDRDTVLTVLNEGRGE